MIQYLRYIKKNDLLCMQSNPKFPKKELRLVKRMPSKAMRMLILQDNGVTPLFRRCQILPLYHVSPLQLLYADYLVGANKKSVKAE